MASLFPVLPVFLDLAGRAAVMLSADEQCLPVARQLLDAGASLSLIDPQPHPGAQALAPPARLVRRTWRAADMRHAALVVAARAERRARRAQVAAHAVGAVFFMFDAPHLSDIVLGETAARGPLAMALAAPGLPPALNQALLARIEAAAPARLTGFLQAAAACGARPEDGRFWRDTLAAALSDPPADWAAWLAARLEARA